MKMLSLLLRFKKFHRMVVIVNVIVIIIVKVSKISQNGWKSVLTLHEMPESMKICSRQKIVGKPIALGTHICVGSLDKK